MTDEAARSKPKVISDAALIYSQIPEFHREFLKAVFSIDQIERGLSDSSKLNEDRLLQHNRVVSRRLGLRLSLAEVNALLFPIRYESCLTVREHLEPENFINNPERVLIKDVIELMRQGHLTGDHLSPSELDHRRSIKDINEKYPAAVVNLLELEKVSYRLNPVSNSIVKVWRQYIDLQTAKLKQGALPSVNSSGHVDTPDGVPVQWLLKPASRKRQVPGQVVEAAYRYFRKKNERNHKNVEELFSVVEPELLPDLVECRRNVLDVYHVEITLKDGRRWGFKQFRDVCLKNFD